MRNTCFLKADKEIIQDCQYVNVVRAYFEPRFTGKIQDGGGHNSLTSEVSILKKYWTGGRFDVIQRALEVLEVKFLPSEPFYNLNLREDDINMNSYKNKMFVESISVKETDLRDEDNLLNPEGPMVSIEVTVGSLY